MPTLSKQIIYCIVDELDEVEALNRQELLNLFAGHSALSLNLFLTSRTEVYVAESDFLESLETHAIEITSDKNRSDIQTFIHNRINKSALLGSTVLRSKVAASLNVYLEGAFL